MCGVAGDSVASGITFIVTCETRTKIERHLVRDCLSKFIQQYRPFSCVWPVEPSTISIANQSIIVKYIPLFPPHHYHHFQCNQSFALTQLRWFLVLMFVRWHAQHLHSVIFSLYYLIIKCIDRHTIDGLLFKSVSPRRITKSLWRWFLIGTAQKDIWASTRSPTWNLTGSIWECLVYPY